MSLKVAIVYLVTMGKEIQGDGLSIVRDNSSQSSEMAMYRITIDCGEEPSHIVQIARGRCESSRAVPSQPEPFQVISSHRELSR